MRLLDAWHTRAMMSVLLVALGYVMGSVPFALLVTRRRGLSDIRQTGSGNVGATNVLRVAGLNPALLTAVLDIAKGAAPPLLAGAAGAGLEIGAASAAAAVAGHVFPVWLRFRGGKGVATSFGACLALSPAVGGLALTVFVTTVFLSRIISLGSVVAAVVIGPLAAWAGEPRPVVLALFSAGALIVFRHQGNLRRLAAGTERRIGH